VLGWPVAPRRLLELTQGKEADPAGAERAMKAMKAMLSMGKIDLAQVERAYAGETGLDGPQTSSSRDES
jgi:hypothetical protein